MAADADSTSTFSAERFTQGSGHAGADERKRRRFDKSASVCERTREQEVADSSDSSGSSESSSQAIAASRADQTRNATRMPFRLGDLEREVENLRSNPPPYVQDVGHLKKPSLVCESGRLRPPSGPGPWDLTIVVTGSARNEAYNAPWRLGLRFDTRWPRRPPTVRFLCVIHHALLNENRGMMAPFYSALAKDEHGVHTLQSIVHSVHKFLVDPLEGGWKMDVSNAPPHFVMAVFYDEQENEERLTVIRKYAKIALHKEFFQTPAAWQSTWFDPAFVKAREVNSAESWRGILTEHLAGEVFSFALFSDVFCDLLLKEIFNFYGSGLPARRPNNMNNYGIVLNEIGLESMIDELQGMLQPLGELLFPGAGHAWDSHHCFIVRYRAGEDLGLDMHTDDSDVTFNVCLGLEFTGAGLQFCGRMGAANHRRHTCTYTHAKGRCVVHLGRKRHGADDITSGERLNLILWNHSSTYRESDAYRKPPYHVEAGPPDPVCLSYTHDRDYGTFKSYPTGKEKFKGRGWCPPVQKQYFGFKPEDPGAVVEDHGFGHL